MAGSNIKFEKSMLLLVIVFIIIITTSVIVVSALQTNPVEDIIASGEPIKILFVLEDQGNVLFTDIFVYYPVLARGALFDIPGNTSDIFSSINRVDRIDAIFREKGVVDFLEFGFMNFPIFNIADTFLTIGVFMLAIYVLFISKDGLLPFMKKQEEKPSEEENGLS